MLLMPANGHLKLASHALIEPKDAAVANKLSRDQPAAPAVDHNTTAVLACTGAARPRKEVLAAWQQLLRHAESGRLQLEDAFVGNLNTRQPLAKQDLLAAGAEPQHVEFVTQALFDFFQTSQRSHSAPKMLGGRANQLVQQCQELERLVGQCADHAPQLVEAAQKQRLQHADRELDEQVKEWVGRMREVVQEVQQGLLALPLLLEACFMWGDLVTVVAALLADTRFTQLVDRWGLFQEVLMLLRVLARSPEVLPLLQKASHEHMSVSAWEALVRLAEEAQAARHQLPPNCLRMADKVVKAYVSVRSKIEQGHAPQQQYHLQPHPYAHAAPQYHPPGNPQPHLQSEPSSGTSSIDSSTPRSTHPPYHSAPASSSALLRPPSSPPLEPPLSVAAAPSSRRGPTIPALHANHTPRLQLSPPSLAPSLTNYYEADPEDDSPPDSSESYATTFEEEQNPHLTPNLAHSHSFSITPTSRRPSLNVLSHMGSSPLPGSSANHRRQPPLQHEDPSSPPSPRQQPTLTATTPSPSSITLSLPKRSAPATSAASRSPPSPTPAATPPRPSPPQPSLRQDDTPALLPRSTGYTSSPPHPPPAPRVPMATTTVFPITNIPMDTPPPALTPPVQLPPQSTRGRQQQQQQHHHHHHQLFSAPASPPSSASTMDWQPSSRQPSYPTPAPSFANDLYYLPAHSEPSPLTAALPPKPSRPDPNTAPPFNSTLSAFLHTSNSPTSSPQPPQAPPPADSFPGTVVEHFTINPLYGGAHKRPPSATGSFTAVATHAKPPLPAPPVGPPGPGAIPPAEHWSPLSTARNNSASFAPLQPPPAATSLLPSSFPHAAAPPHPKQPAAGSFRSSSPPIPIPPSQRQNSLTFGNPMAGRHRGPLNGPPKPDNIPAVRFPSDVDSLLAPFGAPPHGPRAQSHPGPLPDPHGAAFLPPHFDQLQVSGRAHSESRRWGPHAGHLPHPAPHADIHDALSNTLQHLNPGELDVDTTFPPDPYSAAWPSPAHGAYHPGSLPPATTAPTVSHLWDDLPSDATPSQRPPSPAPLRPLHDALPASSRPALQPPARQPRSDSDTRDSDTAHRLALHPDHIPVDLVGPHAPVSGLVERYQSTNMLVAAKMVSLECVFPTFRRVVGDGNCFYRAFLFALLERIVVAADVALCDRLQTVVPRLMAQAEGVLPSVHPGARRGAEVLADLLHRMWFRGGEQPLDLPGLERLLSTRATFDPLVRLVRAITSAELRAEADHYSPFLAGSDTDRQGMSLPEICDKFVERMDMEVEQVQVAALVTALGVPVGILDVAHSDTAYLKLPQRAAAPAFWLLHTPGHYDVVYPAEPSDVRDGTLVPLQ